MWADELQDGESWAGIWYHLVHCDQCHALFSSGACPRCGRNYSDLGIPGEQLRGGEVVVSQTLPGAISWSTHVLFDLMKREWQRPVDEKTASSWGRDGQGPSPRMLIVILFWTHFEHLMDRFFDAATSKMPPGVKSDLLRRYATIGSRMDRLYQMLFASKLKDDLAALGYGTVFQHLEMVQQRRNQLVHGDPEAIDETLVRDTVAQLPLVQEAYVALYNLRCAGDPSAPPVWKSLRSPA